MNTKPWFHSLSLLTDLDKNGQHKPFLFNKGKDWAPGTRDLFFSPKYKFGRPSPVTFLEYFNQKILGRGFLCRSFLEMIEEQKNPKKEKKKGKKPATKKTQTQSARRFYLQQYIDMHKDFTSLIRMMESDLHQLRNHFPDAENMGKDNAFETLDNFIVQTSRKLDQSSEMLKEYGETINGDNGTVAVPAAAPPKEENLQDVFNSVLVDPTPAALDATTIDLENSL